MRLDATRSDPSFWEALRGPSNDFSGWPIPPGESPFKIKGNAYRRHIEYVEKNIPGGLAAQLAAERDRRVVDFFSQTFLAGSWYDLAPLIGAGHVCARLTQRSFLDFVQIRSNDQAEADLNGIYRMLLKLANPQSVARRSPHIWAQYCKFGQVESLPPEANRARTMWGDIPFLMAPWVCLAIQVGFGVAVAAAGGVNPRTRFSNLVRGKVAQGVEMVNFDSEITWL